MESEDALLALAALAQPTRLEAVRCLVRVAPGGIAAGVLADRLAVPANTLSSHLSVLSRAGLVQSERSSRSIVYRVSPERLRGLILFLLEDCCAGRAELCDPLLADLAVCRA
jgi:DNA-binding transcriptional ArsR family regulator